MMLPYLDISRQDMIFFDTGGDPELFGLEIWFKADLSVSFEIGPTKS